MDNLKSFLEFDILSLGDYTIQVYALFFTIVIFFITKLILWGIKKAMLRKGLSSYDLGNRYALYQIIQYIIWVVSVAMILDVFGVKLTVLLAGSAALMVGVGLGLQQTFNDIISGIIILSERSIKVGDVLQIDDDIVKIEQVGLRTSKCLNRDDISVIVPNSIISNNKVINWSHQTQQTRFQISVHVAYGSPLDLVVKLLEESAREHPEVCKESMIDARFVDFGNSSLDFILLFFSNNIFRIEKVKSDIRKSINQKFIDNGINIPFPQMDLHLKSKDFA